MPLYQVQYSSWDKVSDFYSDNVYPVGKGVIVQSEAGLELGEIVGVKEAPSNTSDIREVVRIASDEDIRAVCDPEKKQNALDKAKFLSRRFNLPMKFVDVRFSPDSKRIVFAFIADNRVDFRELVKELTRTFNAIIRLQQIGIRDEARMSGDFGHCGMVLCCSKFLRELASITSEIAEVQQCSHRGSDRISGICGRLMCCLAYEADGYRELQAKLPPIGSRIKVKGKNGIVIGHHTLKGSIKVELIDDPREGRVIVEVDLKK